MKKPMEQPSQQRHKTNYPGVTYRIRQKLGGKKGTTERVYYIRYKRPGDKKPVEKKIGRQTDGMTPARANQKRVALMLGRE